QRAPHPALEGCAAHREREIEGGTPTVEVLLDLTDCFGDVCACDVGRRARNGRRRAVERQQGDPVVVRIDDERTDGTAQDDGHERLLQRWTTAYERHGRQRRATGSD